MTALSRQTIDAARQNEGQLLASWQASLEASGASRDARINHAEFDAQTRDFLRLLVAGAHAGDSGNIAGSEWADTRSFLDGLSRSRALQGFDSQTTANFIFSLKRPLFELLQAQYANNAAELATQLWAVTELVDALGLYTVRAFQKSREEVIARQQEELLELSTPVVKLWDGVLALPMIGTLDSQRTQVVMESLLQRIVETGS